MDGLLDNALVWVLIGLTAFFFGVVIGFDGGETNIAADCDNFGAFVYGGAKYECKKAAP